MTQFIRPGNEYPRQGTDFSGPLSFQDAIDHGDGYPSPQELLAQLRGMYNNVLRVTIDAAGSRYADTTLAYRSTVIDIRGQHGHADDLARNAEKLGLAVTDYSTQARYDVNDIVMQGGRIFSSIAAHLDPVVWKGVQDLIRDRRDPRSMTVKAKIDGASSPEAREAMTLALDADVWKGVQDLIRDRRDPRSMTVKAKIDGASSPEAREAMTLALDADVWKGVQDLIRDRRDPRSMIVKAKIDGASSPEAREAMTLALDADVWKGVQDLIRDRRDPRSMIVKAKIDGASSPEAREIMSWSLGRPSGSPRLDLGSFAVLGSDRQITGVINSSAVKDEAGPVQHSPGQLIDTGSKFFSGDIQDAKFPEGWSFEAPAVPDGVEGGHGIPKTDPWKIVVKPNGRTVHHRKKM